MKRWLLVVLLSVLACTRAPKHSIEKVTISGATVDDNAILGMSGDEVLALFRSRLQNTGHFVFLEGADGKPLHAVRIELELNFTRQAKKEGRDGTWAEVGASAVVSQREKDETRRYDVVGLAEVAQDGDTAEARQKAVKQALEVSLQQIASSADVLLTALQKSDKDLEKDLKSPDPRVKEYALRVLAERGNPVVVDALLEKLKTNDFEEVHRAIGALVEMKEKRAVPALIELSKNRDPGFVREIVFALGSIGGDEAEAYLFTVAQGADQPELQKAAEEAMAELRRTREAKAAAKGE